MKSPIKGKFIHVEGGDGSGKTTQAKLLIKWLNQKGYKTCYGRFPGFTKVGEKIRRLTLQNKVKMDNETRRVLIAANHISFLNEVYKKRKRDTVYIFDRYIPISNYIFGVYGDKISRLFMKGLNKFISLNYFPKSYRPDLIIVYNVSDKAIKQRLQKRKNSKGEMNIYDKKGADFKSRIRKGYSEIKSKKLFPHESKFIHCIDADGSKKEVFEKTTKLLEKTFKV